ncbi:hypothetical protein ACHAXT_006525 [Thalassiosira profunda]
MARRLVLPSVAAALTILFGAAPPDLLLVVDAASPPDVPKSGSDASAKVATVANQNQNVDPDALRARLQSHVEDHVNRLLSEQAAGGVNGAVGSGGKGSGSLDLKIDLPPDLARLVAGQGGAAVTIHKDPGTGAVTWSGEGKQPRAVYQGGGVVLGSDPPAAAAAATAATGEEGPSESSESGAAEPEEAAAAPCPLGTYTHTGYYPTEAYGTCASCPDGQTTLKRGSTDCVPDPTEAELLGMLYDLVGGDAWKDEQKRGWKSDIPVCEWEGITCNAEGEINGLAFPMMGLKNCNGGAVGTGG